MTGASLVAQWWRVCQCRRHRFDPWSRRNPHLLSNWAQLSQLLSLCPRTREPQLWSYALHLLTHTHPEPLLHKKKSHSREMSMPCSWREAPLGTTRGSPGTELNSGCIFKKKDEIRMSKGRCCEVFCLGEIGSIFLFMAQGCFTFKFTPN